ncbi:MAG: HNH endonuclease signature motif containing protein [Planctomycetota bacterium]|nr:HNH endonuclease signature motif containing protein [Planctomycetota bacterium]
MADGPSGEIAAQNAFSYPAGLHIRKHGPAGYSDYEQYRDWLRDEFSFRCIVCLQREKWDRLTAAFHIDHIVPQTIAPDKKLDYGNLVYLCARCNIIKGARTVPDPCAISLQGCLRVSEDGAIVGLNQTGQRLIGVFRLDPKQAYCPDREVGQGA